MTDTARMYDSSRDRIMTRYDLSAIAQQLCVIFVVVQLAITTTAANTVNHVTCGSVVKLENEAKPKFRLHSHDIKYGSGSGQQSVTAVENQDTNSYW